MSSIDPTLSTLSLYVSLGFSVQQLKIYLLHKKAGFPHDNDNKEKMPFEEIVFHRDLLFQLVGTKRTFLFLGNAVVGIRCVA
mmetsp:Transcript_29608/g.62376  ORF Transcript_29608/g.62376 Transcript_29608/m.62376 type:complete len:82 (+) Transcript_29608:12-257(+)